MFIDDAVPACIGIEAAILAPFLVAVALFTGFNFAVAAIGFEHAVGAPGLMGDVIIDVALDIALFGTGDDTVTAYGRACTLPHLKESGECKAETRTTEATLCVEHVEGVDTAFEHVEFFGGLVEVDLAFPRGMNPTDVDAKAAVKENPHVIIAIERKDLATIVLEVRVELRGELAIVSGRRVALAIDGEERTAGIGIRTLGSRQG